MNGLANKMNIVSLDAVRYIISSFTYSHVIIYHLAVLIIDIEPYRSSVWYAQQTFIYIYIYIAVINTYVYITIFMRGCDARRQWTALSPTGRCGQFARCRGASLCRSRPKHAQRLCACLPSRHYYVIIPPEISPKMVCSPARKTNDEWFSYSPRCTVFNKSPGG